MSKYLSRLLTRLRSKPRRFSIMTTKPSESEHENFNQTYYQAYPNATVEVPNPGKCVIESDGIFNKESFNPKGDLHLNALMNVFDLNSGLAFYRPTGAQYLDVRNRGHLSFAVSVKLVCEPELYSPDVAKSPVKVIDELVFVGKSSHKCRMSLYLPQVKKPVAQKELGLVLVDPVTRKPAGHPAWWLDKHLPYSRPGEGRIQVPSFDFQACAGSLQKEQICVQTIDVDSNGHCSHISFARYCHEVYGRVQFRRFGSTVRGNPFRRVKCLTATYKGEASLGDLLTVCFVQDPADEDTFHFQISRGEPGVVLFECHLTYYPLVISKC